MSQFDFPRINFNGTIKINVGTGNNDDYSLDVRVSDSMDVQPIMNGNTTDKEFLDWATTIQSFNSPNKNQDTTQIIPGEWNYFGDMSIIFQDDVKVAGIQTVQGQVVSDPIKNSIIGSSVNMNPAILIDVNPEGVSCSQVFCDNFSIINNGQTIFSGKPSKSSTRFINFTRNVDLNASTGASASFYSVIPLEDVDPTSSLLNDESVKGLSGLKGFMLRYNFYRFITPKPGNEAIQALYENYDTKQLSELLNPKIGIICGTLSPWFEGEMKSITLGRYLIPQDSFPNPNYKPNGTGTGNGPDFTLAPITAKVGGGNSYVSLDIINSFVNTYDLKTNQVGMFDIGTVNLYLQNGTINQLVGSINYDDYNSYLQSGGLVDIPITKISQQDIESGSFNIQSTKYSGKTLMNEANYMIASDQGTVYADQNDTSGNYNSYGTPEPVVIQGVYKGSPITQATAIKLVAYEYRMVPNNNQGYTGYSENITLSGGTPVTLSLQTKTRGNFLYLLLPEGTEPPTLPDLESGFFINIRILPTDDYSQYINHPDTLTWDILHNNVLRYYRLIFPAMNMVFPFQEDYWSNSAAMIYERVGLDWWDKVEYMPRTRDLSDSRRQLIRAWLKKYMPTT